MSTRKYNTSLPDPSLGNDDPAVRVLDSLPLPTRRQAQVPGADSGARPLPSRMLHAESAALADRVQRLELERKGGGVVLKLDPKLIAHSQFANRHALSLSTADPKYIELKASFQKNGQDQEIIVRSAPADAGHRLPYEVGAGHRRHAVALELDRETEGGFSILARVKEMTDLELALLMHRENEERKDTSPYEKGLMYKNWLDTGLFKRQADIAAATNVNETSIFRYIQLTDLPDFVIGAFRDPRSIALRWTQDLAQSLKRNEVAVREAAARLVALDPAPEPQQVLRELMAAGSSSNERSSSRESREESVKIKGQVAFRLTRRHGRLTLKWAPRLDREVQARLSEDIREFALERIGQLEAEKKP